MNETTPQAILNTKKLTETHARKSNWLFVTGIGAILLVLLLHIVTIDRQGSWQDEIFVVSTGLSIARSQPPIPSVTAQYPRSNSPVKFYGPVSFEADALLIRAFGLSMAPWRLACLGGLILTMLASAGLVGLAGGDRWAQLAAALILVLAGSIALQFPGRWDFVTAGLVLSGLLLLLRGVELGNRSLLWGVAVGGALIGFALGSTPRALTLCFAALISALLTAGLFPRVRKNLLLGSFAASAVAVLIQNLLLLPWGLNSFSWYAFVREATKQDALDATAITGRGTWNLDLPIHKILLLVLLLLFAVALLSGFARRRADSDEEKTPLKLFLSLFAAMNLSLMLLLLARSLGQAAFWLPPVVVALLCWFEWKALSAKNLGALAVGLIGAALLILGVRETEYMTATFLTWNRRSTADLTAFVRRTLPKGAVVYGPISGDFYPVELAGDHYLYLHDQSRGRPSEPYTSISQKVEEEVCSHPAYTMWPELDRVNQQFWGPIPKPLADRLQPEVGEFRRPGLAPWKEALLRWLGPIGGKFGFPDLAVYPLKSLNQCGEK